MKNIVIISFSYECDCGRHLFGCSSIDGNSPGKKSVREMRKTNFCPSCGKKVDFKFVKSELSKFGVVLEEGDLE